MSIALDTFTPPAHAARACDGVPRPVDEELPLGAHLITPRKGYTHHGIHVGGGRVVHYAGLSRSFASGPVEEVSLAQFAAGRAVAVKPRGHDRFSAVEAVARARSRLGEDRYRLTTNNCEHFCEWCLSGNGRSEQVEHCLAWVRALRLALRRGAAVVLGAGLRPRGSAVAYR